MVLSVVLQHPAGDATCLHAYAQTGRAGHPTSQADPHRLAHLGSRVMCLQCAETPISLCLCCRDLPSAPTITNIQSLLTGGVPGNIQITAVPPSDTGGSGASPAPRRRSGSGCELGSSPWRPAYPRCSATPTHLRCPLHTPACLQASAATRCGQTRWAAGAPSTRAGSRTRQSAARQERGRQLVDGGGQQGGGLVQHLPLHGAMPHETPAARSEAALSHMAA